MTSADIDRLIRAIERNSEIVALVHLLEKEERCQARLGPWDFRPDADLRRLRGLIVDCLMVAIWRYRADLSYGRAKQDWGLEVLLHADLCDEALDQWTRQAKQVIRPASERAAAICGGAPRGRRTEDRGDPPSRKASLSGRHHG